MLPAPSANFTLPSLYDDLELNCRLYFPRARTEDGRARYIGCATLAHPYAPLGGSYDDPVVHAVGSDLVRQGFVLATFNFRGAETSAGKTTWSGKAELGDYVSVYAFVLAFMSIVRVSDGMSTMNEHDVEKSPLLLLGGYSYGSMITAHLPDVKLVTDILQQAKVGSAEDEIIHRAEGLAKAFLGYCEAQHLRGRSSLKATDTLSGAGATFGGYESASAARRASREGSRRSIDREKVRQSMDRVRRKLGSRNDSDDTQRSLSADDLEKFQVMPRQVFLLISPLLGPISSFATMFSKLRFERRDRHATAAKDGSSTDPNEALSKHKSLIVFGSQDHFTSGKKVREWCKSLTSRPDSQATFVEVEQAGHFWHDQEQEKKMREAILGWLQNL